MAAHDAGLAEMLLGYLTADRQRRRGVRVVGEERAGAERMPTVSFLVVEGEHGGSLMKRTVVVEGFDRKGKVSWLHASKRNAVLMKKTDWHSIWSFLCLRSC